MASKPGSATGINSLFNLIDTQNQRQNDLKKNIDAARLTYEKNMD